MEGVSLGGARRSVRPARRDTPEGDEQAQRVEFASLIFVAGESHHCGDEFVGGLVGADEHP